MKSAQATISGRRMRSGTGTARMGEREEDFLETRNVARERSDCGQASCGAFAPSAACLAREGDVSKPLRGVLVTPANP